MFTRGDEMDTSSILTNFNKDRDAEREFFIFPTSHTVFCNYLTLQHTRHTHTTELT